MRTILFAIQIDLFVHAAGRFLTPTHNTAAEWIVYNLHIVYNVNLCKYTEKQHFRNKYGKTLIFQGLRGLGVSTDGHGQGVSGVMSTVSGRIVQGTPGH